MHAADISAGHSYHTAGGILALTRAESYPEPEPLRRPLPPAKRYPLDALGDVLGKAAARIHAVVQAPAGMCAQSVLAAASLAAQAHADVVIDGRRELLSLWHLTIGDSGERKSAADGWALREHREFERAEGESYRHAKALHDVDAKAFETASNRVAKGKDTDAIKQALLGMGAPPDAPLLPYRLIPEPTLEGLHKLYIAGQPSMGLFSDDAGEFLGGHAMNRDNRIKSAAGMSRLWDSGEFSRVRSGDGAAKHYGRRLALHLMVQPVIAESVLSDDVLTGQGFLARCLLAWPTSTVGTRRYAEIDLSADADMLRYWARMHDLLGRVPILRLGTRNELEPRTLSLDPDAKARWIEVQNAIEVDMAERGDFASIRAWASKGGAQVLRIASVLTLVDDPDAGVIHYNAIEQAARLTQWHLHEAARIIGTAAIPIEVKHAEALVDWCRESRIDLLHSRAALRLGPNCIRTRKAFDAAIEELERSGYAARVEGGAIVDGAHRRRVWTMWRAA